MNKLVKLSIILFCFSCSPNLNHIGIQPYGDVDQKVISSISGVLKKTYKTEVVILSKKTLPKSAFVNIKSPRYRADSLLKDLLKKRPDTIDFIIGVTSKDISTTKRDSEGKIKKPESKYTDWGIFGLGYKPGRSCVVSTFRLKKAKADLLESRIQKISIHEIGHNLGLDHCETERCVMQDAVETINTVDSAGFELCEKCFREIN